MTGQVETDTPDKPVGIDDDELELMSASRRWHRTHGRPESAFLIEIAIKKGQRLDDDQRRALLRIDDTVPEVDVDPLVVAPPRTGKGASKKNWREFAAAVTDWEPEVIKDAGMGEIIAMLEANGVIPTVGAESE